MAITGSRSVEIDAPIQTCFDIAADIEGAPAWQGSLKKVDVLERDGEGRPTLVDTENDAKVKVAKSRLRFSYQEPTGITWVQEKGDTKSTEGSWAFEDLGGRTRATYALDIGLNRALSLVAKTIKGPAEQKVRQLLAHRPVEGLKARAEA